MLITLSLACRARLEILQLQQIRRMWEDLQTQIYALHGAVRGGESESEAPQPSTSRQSADPPASTSTSASTSAQAATEQLTDDDSDNPGEVSARFHTNM